MSREEEIRAGLFEHTLNGHAPEVKALTEEGLRLGMDPMDILFKALIPSLEEVGRRFEKGDFFVPEMLIAARAMQGALVSAVTSSARSRATSTTSARTSA
jgi:5-methyltetrahydrofolate--homocysteine methyltransferase